MSQEFSTNPSQQAYEVMNRIEGQLISTVEMSEMDRLAVVGAVCLGSAILFEGVPGTGKTTIAKSIAKAIGGTFKRVQGTPDLLPSDLTGVNVFNKKTNEFEFEPGPLLEGNVLLIDEMNRMPEKTQAGLLEAMQENQVTVGRNTYEVMTPFVVLATQNESGRGHGTYNLINPLADRFGIGIDFPEMDRDTTLRVLNIDAKPERVIDDVNMLNTAAQAIHGVKAPSEVQNHAITIVETLRELDDIIDRRASMLGGARPVQNMLAHAKAFAVQQDPSNIVRREHVNQAAQYVLTHRTALTFTAKDEGKTGSDAVRIAIERAA